jgi:hypothetical protein
MHEPIPCPQCGAPAQITERFRHWLTPLAEMVQGARPALPGQVPAPLPAR